MLYQRRGTKKSVGKKRFFEVLGYQTNLASQMIKMFGMVLGYIF